MNDADLAASIPFEIRRHIPAGDSADRKVMHQVLARDKATRRMSVLVCTAPVAGIEEARDRFLGTGVRPKRMEPAPLAAVNHMIHSGIAPDDDSCWGVLDVGATGSWLAFSKGGDSLYIRSIHIGGSSFTQELVLRCRISREEADQVKRAEVSLGKIRPEWRTRTATLPSLLRNTLDGLAEEVLRHANRYRTKNGPVRRLFLGGGGALVHGLDQVLEHRLAIPVELVDPFRPFELPAGWPERKRDLLSEIGPRFLVALGLTRWWRR
jgi:type IV pilus assembly protein PilM